MTKQLYAELAEQLLELQEPVCTKRTPHWHWGVYYQRDVDCKQGWRVPASLESRLWRLLQSLDLLVDYEICDGPCVIHGGAEAVLDRLLLYTAEKLKEV